MRYMGGKTRIAKRLAAAIHECAPDVDQFWDAFCGGLSMSVALSAYGRVISSDANAALISLYAAVRDGWDPPASVSRAEYAAARELPDSDPLKAFCAVGCSYGGKWFGGYAYDAKGTRNRDGVPSNYALSAKRRLIKEVRAPSEVECLRFEAIAPLPIDGAIYCDPPYAGTTGYAGVRAFDHDRFVRRVVEWSRHAHVFVSEYAFPVGRVVWAGESTTTLAKSHIKSTERLYWIGRGSL